MIRLASQLDRYGEAIAADLALAGWDVVDLYESGRYAFTLNLVERLPSTSWFAKAVADDEDLAELMADEARKPEPPSTTEWTREVELLSTLGDRIAELITVTIKLNGQKASRTQPLPRPVTEIDKARARRRSQGSRDLEARLFPHLHNDDDR